jgi:hypothetical protein
MHYLRSSTNDCSCLSIPSRGTVQAFSSARCGCSISVSSTFRIRSASLASPVLRLLCPLQTSAPRSEKISLPPASFSRTRDPRAAAQISQGKTQNVPRVDAGFIQHTPWENAGLRGHVPARPGCTTPQIRFVYLAPRFWIGLPSDPASRLSPCPSPSLRLLLYLASGLAPDEFCAMPGTHAAHNRPTTAARSAAVVGPCSCAC